MARPKGSYKSTPKLRHHKPSGRAVVTIEGREHYVGKYGTPEARTAYEQLLRKCFAERARTTSEGIPKEEVTVAEIVTAFLADIRANLSHTSTLVQSAPTLRRLLARYGDMKASAFGPLALKAFRESLVNSNREWKHGGKDVRLARNTINKAITTVRTVFRFAASNEMIPPERYHGLLSLRRLRRGGVARDTDPIQPASRADVEATLKFLPKMVQSMVQLQILTGMRGGEICVMRTCDIDTTGTVWIYRPHAHKTKHKGHTREVRIGPKAQEILRTLLKPDLQAYIFSPAESWENHRNERFRPASEKLAAVARILADPLVPTLKQRGRRWQTLGYGSPRNFSYWLTIYRRGRRRPTGTNGAFSAHYQPRCYGKAIYVAARKAGVPHWHPHRIRHLFASEVANHHNREVTKLLLGHRSCSITDRYIKPDPSIADGVAAIVG